MNLFILTLFHSGYKLRISTLYHLITNRRTSSVLLHGFFYDNLGFLNLLPELTQTEFDQQIIKLQKKNWITIEDGQGQLTALGRQTLEQVDFSIIQQLQSLRYGRGRKEMWDLLVFAVQVTSQLSFHEKNYVPLESRPFFLHQVKKWLASSEGDLLTLFPNELAEVFQKMPQIQADFLAQQFSGYAQMGRAAFQVMPADWQKKPWDTIYQGALLDCFFTYARSKKQIQRLIHNSDQKNYNQSMLKTRHLFLNGQSIEQIMSKRHLKKGTINDHFIEWALLDSAFPFQRFQLTLDVANEDVRTYQFQDFADLDYLDFRLSQIAYLKDEHRL